jgi:hypothetical protein
MEQEQLEPGLSNFVDQQDAQRLRGAETGATCRRRNPGPVLTRGTFHSLRISCE